jgi:hypothetical protein
MAYGKAVDEKKEFRGKQMMLMKKKQGWGTQPLTPFPGGVAHTHTISSALLGQFLNTVY